MNEDNEISHHILQGLSDLLAGVSSFNDHGVFDVFYQFGCSALKKALGALRFRPPIRNNYNNEIKQIHKLDTYLKRTVAIHFIVCTVH